MADCGNWQAFSPVVENYAAFNPVADSYTDFDGVVNNWAGFEPCLEVPPTVNGGIPDQVNTVGDVGGFDASVYFNEGTGSDPVYTATGMPNGASISATGYISYDLLDPGISYPVVTLDTGVSPPATNTFIWLVNPGVPPVTAARWGLEGGIGAWSLEDDIGDWILEE